MKKVIEKLNKKIKILESYILYIEEKGKKCQKALNIRCDERHDCIYYQTCQLCKNPCKKNEFFNIKED